MACPQVGEGRVEGREEASIGQWQPKSIRDGVEKKAESPTWKELGGICVSIKGSIPKDTDVGKITTV